MSNINDFIIEDGVLVKYKGDGGDVVIPDGVTRIGENAFCVCSSLISITIPDSVTSIGITAFTGCTSLTSVIIPDSVTSIDGYAFLNCTALTLITISRSVTNIDSGVFSRCTSLASVIIPDSVTSIDGLAFSGCTALTSITIPDSVTSIGWSVFEGCKSLEKIVIPGSVKVIQTNTFEDCVNLKKVTLSEGIVEIQYDSFKNCINLESVNIPESVQKLSEKAFRGCVKLPKIKLKKRKKSTEKNPDNQFINLKPFIADVDITMYKDKVFYVESEECIPNTVFLIKKWGGKLTNEVTESTDFFVTMGSLLRRKISSIDDNMKKFIEKFEIDKVPFLLSYETVFEQNLAYWVSLFKKESKEEKMQRAFSLFEKSIKDLRAKMEKSKKFNDPIIKSPNLKFDIDKNIDVDSVNEFFELLYSSFYEKYDLPEDFIKFCKYHTEQILAGKKYELDGVVGVEVPVAVGVVIFCFFEPSAQISFEIIRDKWEYRGDYSSKNTLMWNLSPVYSDGCAYFYKNAGFNETSQWM